LLLFPVLLEKQQILNIYKGKQFLKLNIQENVMEISSHDITNLSIEEIPLEMKDKFTLCFTKVVSDGKLYIADVYIKFERDVVAHNWLETIEFFSFIDAYIKRGFISSHENSFFKVSQEDKVTSLKCKFSLDEYFLSTPKVKTMLTVYNEFRSGNTLKDLIVSKTILSNEEAQVTIFSSHMNEEDVKNEIREHLQKSSNTKSTNYTLFDEETLKYYNMIKYAGGTTEED
jgi:hypothetical protein